MKFTTGVKELRESFLLTTILDVVGTTEEGIRQINHVQVCCHRESLCQCFSSSSSRSLLVMQLDIILQTTAPQLRAVALKHHE